MDEGLSMELGFFEEVEMSTWCEDETIRNRLTGEVYFLIGTI